MEPDNRRALFWSKVKKTPGCWLWQAATLPKGYGQFWLPRRMHPAHRVAWMLERGPIPPGFEVCHKCDVRNCVRPDHLFLGTHAENISDMVRKGRGHDRRAEKNSNARLDWNRVRAIRARFKAGETNRSALARAYGITHRQVINIVENLQWVEKRHRGSHSM